MERNFGGHLVILDGRSHKMTAITLLLKVESEYQLVWLNLQIEKVTSHLDDSQTVIARNHKNGYYGSSVKGRDL